MYSTSSMLGTMELILGPQPMTQSDAAATPMVNTFGPLAEVTTYVAAPAQVDSQRVRVSRFNFVRVISFLTILCKKYRRTLVLS